MRVLHIVNMVHMSGLVSKLIDDYAKTIVQIELEALVDLTEDENSFDSYDLVVIECDKGSHECEAILSKLLIRSTKQISIIIISDFTNFIFKTQLFDLGIMAVMKATPFNQGKFRRYLETIKESLETVTFLRNMRIAVVDDCNFTLKLIKDFFVRLEINNVEYYSSSKYFIEQEMNHVLYLMDMVMPVYDGEDLIYRIREHNHNAIILLITTYGDGKAIQHCVNIGADDFIIKPLDFKLLMLRIGMNIRNYRHKFERQAHSKALYELATTDALTQVFNRTYFIEQFNLMSHELKITGGKFSMILLDLDHFKGFNDEYGHQVGDRILKAVAELLTMSLRDTDTVCRWGGEEFIVLLAGTEIDAATYVAEKLRIGIESLKLEGIRKITASFGVTQWRLDDDKESMFKRIDNSLYLAKLTGRNKVVSNEEITLYKSGLPVSIEWGPFFRSGNETVDLEHQQLIGLSNEIIVNCFLDNNRTQMLELFQKLLDEIEEHFEDEETILLEHGYLKYNEHKQIHRDLTKKTVEIQEKLVSGQMSPVNVAKYLIQEVVVGHIIKSDFEFFDLFRS